MKFTQLRLDGHVVLVRVVDDLLRELDVLLERQVRPVDHHRREAGVDAALARLEAVAVVEVQDDLGLLAAEILRVLDRALGEIAQKRRARVLARTLGDLHDDGRLRLDCRLDDGLDLLHRVEVERGNRVAALDRLGEHLPGVHETQFLVADHLWFLLVFTPFGGYWARIISKRVKNFKRNF